MSLVLPRIGPNELKFAIYSMVIKGQTAAAHKHHELPTFWKRQGKLSLYGGRPFCGYQISNIRLL